MVVVFDTFLFIFVFLGQLSLSKKSGNLEWLLWKPAPLFVARELIEREGTQPYVVRKGEWRRKKCHEQGKIQSMIFSWLRGSGTRASKKSSISGGKSGKALLSPPDRSLIGCTSFPSSLRLHLQDELIPVFRLTSEGSQRSSFQWGILNSFISFLIPFF